MASGVAFSESDKDLEDFDCEICAVGKAQRAAIYGKPTKRAANPGEWLHWDVCGPIDVKTSGGKRWILLGVDDNSRQTLTHFLEEKGDAEEAIMQTVAFVE